MVVNLIGGGNQSTRSQVTDKLYHISVVSNTHRPNMILTILGSLYYILHSFKLRVNTKQANHAKYIYLYFACFYDF